MSFLYKSAKKVTVYIRLHSLSFLFYEQLYKQKIKIPIFVRLKCGYYENNGK